MPKNQQSLFDGQSLRSLPVNLYFLQVSPRENPNPLEIDRLWPSRFHGTRYAACYFPQKPISKLINEDEE